jgi:hypothetical protein
MDNVIIFPAVHFIDGAYWHGNNSYSDLDSLDASLSDGERCRVAAWHEQRRRWLVSRIAGQEVRQA